MKLKMLMCINRQSINNNKKGRTKPPFSIYYTIDN